MNFCKTSPYLFIFSAVLFYFGLIYPTYSVAQDGTANSVLKIISTTMEIEKQVQQSQVHWAEDESNLFAKLSKVKAQLVQSEKQMDKLSRIEAIENKKYIENLRRQKEVARLQNELSLFLESVLNDLEHHIQSDLLFLKQEREQRITDLKKLMIDTTQSPVEKFRRIFNALQIETEYGSTVEVTQDTVELDQIPVMADLLRIGRISLFCQTIDKKKSAIFNSSEKRWQRLPDSVNQSLAKAITMARLEKPIELVKLPFGRIQTQ